jgi:hypothetical protein
MKTYIAFFCLVFAAQALLADVYSEAMRQAHNVANGNPPQGRQPPPTPPSQNNPPPAPPASPQLEATLRNISNLGVDFDALGKLSSTNSADAAKKLLLNDLNVAAQSAKPSAASISKLGDDLASAVAGTKMTDAQRRKLAQNVHAIFNSSQLSPEQQQMIFDGVQKIFESDEIPSDATTSVVNDIKAIASETK